MFWAAANLTISWYLAFLVDIVPVLIRFFLSLAWGHVSEGIKSNLDLYNSVKDTVKPVFYAASGWVSWIILFESIFKLYNSNDPDSSRAAYLPRVSNLWSLCTTSLNCELGIRCCRVPVLLRSRHLYSEDAFTCHR